MKTIFLYGHPDTVEAVYLYLTHLVSERRLRHIYLAMTATMDQATAERLRSAGASVWYCGPTLTPPGGGWMPARADAYLLTGRWGSLPGKVFNAFGEFMANARVTA